MKYIDYTKEELKKNIDLKVVKTTKYKDINIYFSFMYETDVKGKACLSLIKEIVGNASEGLPTKREMMAKKCMLYGASLDAALTTFSYHNCLSFHYNFVDPKYLDGVTLKDYFDFITDTLFRPLIDKESFKENQKILKNAISRRLDKPAIYAHNRFNQILSSQDERFRMLDADIISELDEITLDDVLKTYSDMIAKSYIEIVLIGDVQDELIENIRALPLNERDSCFIDRDEVKLKNVNYIEESKKTAQTALIMAYKLNGHNIFEGNNYYSILLGNAVLGMLPCSLLFIEVREKRSLCYTIDSRDNKKDGMISVSTLISYKNKDRVIKEIRKQLFRLSLGLYSKDIFNMSKRLLVDSLIQSIDDSDGTYNYLHSRGYYSSESFNDMIDGIEKLTKKDISRLFKGYRHIITYVLKGDEETI